MNRPTPRHRWRVVFVSGHSRDVYSTSSDNARETARQANRLIGLTSRADTTPVSVTDLGHVGTDTSRCPICKGPAE